jgi:NADH-quinone oxidoreductase subunit G
VKKIFVNDKEISVPDTSTVMQACELAGEEIPRFCFHDSLSIAGNCRMCLVEVEKSPKPVASCAFPISEGMHIKTNTEKVKKARKGVMEFLLINHPLDCPICDQGGECDLQDQSLYYGKSYSRFEENKRAVEDKNFGPLIKTVMTRCIHCTRCVRFLDEVAGTHELGAINRGENMEIATVVEGGITSELSGNIIDLCPVGALTSKPYAFTARSWELIHHDTIDVTDGLGCNLILDEFQGTIKRALPRFNSEINEEWISDKSRFFYDGLDIQRLDKVFIRDKKHKLTPASWDVGLDLVSNLIKKYNTDEIAIISGPLTDVETMFSAKELFNSLNIYNIDCRFNESNFKINSRADWLFNSKINGVDRADKLLIIGCDPKREATILNARIRKRWLTGGLEIMSLCTPKDLTYKIKHFGNDISLLNDKSFLKKINLFFKKSKYPMLIIGDSILSTEEGEKIHLLAKQIADSNNLIRQDWNGFNVLSSYSSRAGGLEIGFMPSHNGMNAREIKLNISKKKIKLLILIEADDFNIKGVETNSTKIIYIGHHGDKAATKADIILPTTAFTEKKALYVNIEGRPQFTKKILHNKGMAVDSWKVFRALADKLNVNLKYNNHDQLLENIFRNHPEISNINTIISSKWEKPLDKINQLKTFYNNFLVENYYQTCPITRASTILANCKKYLIKNKSLNDG